MTTTPKKRMSKPLKLAVWIGGGIVGLFVVMMIIGSIGVANQPGGWDAEMQRQAAATASQAGVDSSPAAAQDAVDAEAAATSKSGGSKSDDAAASKKAAEAAEKAASEKSAKAEAAKKAASEKSAKAEAAKKAKADATAHPFKAAEESAGVKDLKIHKEGSVLFAAFPIADNFTNGMIATGAQMDTVDILKAVNEHADEYAKVFVQGTFPMEDAYGNSENSTILNVGYDKATIKKINFDGINTDRIWDLRDSGMVHAELQK